MRFNLSPMAKKIQRQGANSSEQRELLPGGFALDPVGGSAGTPANSRRLQLIPGPPDDRSLVTHQITSRIPLTDELVAFSIASA